MFRRGSVSEERVFREKEVCFRNKSGEYLGEWIVFRSGGTCMPSYLLMFYEHNFRNQNGGLLKINLLNNAERNLIFMCFRNIS